MCGNFGLLQLGITTLVAFPEINDDVGFKKVASIDDFDQLGMSLHESLHEVSRLHGLRVSRDAIDWNENDETKEVDTMTASKSLSPLSILQSQTASTEIRGGQAGGYSSLEYDDVRRDDVTIISKRVRLVARKRHALAADLAALYKQKGGRKPAARATLSVIGHTRFATSSVNQVSGKISFEKCKAIFYTSRSSNL